ncbi:MAG TPA: GGDEF domain-containing protein [Acidobacteriaceae bacterium]
MPRAPFPRTPLALLPIIGALLAALAGHKDWPILLSLISLAVVASGSAVIYWSAPLTKREAHPAVEAVAAPVVAREETLVEAITAEGPVSDLVSDPVSGPLPESEPVPEPEQPLAEPGSSGTRAEALMTGHWRETDLLTGLLNSGTFLVRLTETLTQCRTANQTAILVVCDIDAFGEINRTVGLVEANCLLRQTADCFRLTVREGDLLSRLDGDEFGLFFPGLPPEIAETRVRDLRAAVLEAGLLVLPENSAPVTACMGISCFPADGDSVDALLAAAEASLARAKRERQESAGRPVPAAVVVTRHENAHSPRLLPDTLA